MNKVTPPPACYVTRNESMELGKILAAVLVVFNHFSFPNSLLQGVLNSLCEFAVPMFLAISGYFNFGATPEQIRRRLFHILRLYGLAYAVQIICNLILTGVDGGSLIMTLKNVLPDRNGLFLWLTLQKDPFLGHLWYMCSISLCYLLFWGYTKAFNGKPVDYGPLYFLGCIFFAGYLILAVFLPVAGVSLPYESFRNGWFTGIPMFLLGLFLRQYGDVLATAFHITPCKLVVLTLFGMLFCVSQRLLTDISGPSLGLPLGVVGLVWLLISIPELPRFSPVVRHFGNISTGTYLFHVTIGYLFDLLLPDADAMLRPLMILALSLTVGILWDLLIYKRKK